MATPTRRRMREFLERQAPKIKARHAARKAAPVAPRPMPGKSGSAASRTGVPPAHGARRQGKTPGVPSASPRTRTAPRITVDPMELKSARRVTTTTVKRGGARKRGM